MVEPAFRRLCRIFLSPGCRLRFNKPAIFLLLACLTILPLLLVLQRTDSGQEDGRLYTMRIRLPQTALSSQRPGAYLCTSISLKDSNNVTKPIYIVEFESLLAQFADSTGTVVHHILLAECSELPDGVATGGLGWWNCGLGRDGSDNQADYVNADYDDGVSSKSTKEMCSTGLRYLYAYSSQAPVFRLPRGVVMPVGDEKYYGGAHLVLQVHYSSSHQPNRDHRHQVGQRAATVASGRPGLRLSYLSAPVGRHKIAGVHLSAASANQVSSHLTTGCEYTGDLPMRPFALRVHTHSLGRLVTVYRVRRPQLPQEPLAWQLIGQADPRLPQAYYPTNSSGIVVEPGDLVATVCTMDGAKDGADRAPEMCNAWLVYSLDEPPKRKIGIDFNSGKVDLRCGCASGDGGASVWSEAPDWVAKQAVIPT